jgi:hypothetical protein
MPIIYLRTTKYGACTTAIRNRTGVALFNDQEFCSGGRFFGVFQLFLFLQSSRQAALISSAAWLLGWVLESASLEAGLGGGFSRFPG